MHILDYYISIFDFIEHQMQTKDIHFSKQVTDARQIFFGMPKEAPEGLRVVSVGCERCLPEYLVDRKTFPQHTMEMENLGFTTFDFVMEGEGSLTLNENPYRLKPGSIFIYERGIPHRIENSAKKPMLKYFLVCAHKSGIGPLSALVSKPFGVFKMGSLGEIMDLFELILSNANLESENGDEICNSLANALILKICEKSSGLTQSESRSCETYHRTLRYMRRNYFTIKSIEQLADEVNIDAAYLSRIFRRFHKDTPYRFLIRLKMGHAASLLLNSGKLVKNVAFELGFENPFHFSRAFKSVYGISPENFVKERQRDNQSDYPIQ
tara:strand:- start:2060 stop:3031 length:972 start_codon:yes stop_codon:yes gene_type:complete